MPDWNAEFESLKARFNAGTIAGGSLLVAIVAVIFTAIQTHYSALANVANDNNRPLAIPSITNSIQSKLPEQPAISPSNSAPPQAIQSTNLGPLKN